MSRPPPKHMISVEATYKKCCFLVKFKKHDLSTLRDAVETLESLAPCIVSDQDRYSELFFHLATAYHALGNITLAKRNIARMLQINPDHLPTSNLLREILESASETAFSKPAPKKQVPEAIVLTPADAEPVPKKTSPPSKKSPTQQLPGPLMFPMDLDDDTPRSPDEDEVPAFSADCAPKAPTIDYAALGRMHRPVTFQPGSLNYPSDDDDDEPLLLPPSERVRKRVVRQMRKNRKKHTGDTIRNIRVRRRRTLGTVKSLAEGTPIVISHEAIAALGDSEFQRLEKTFQAYVKVSKKARRPEREFFLPTDFVEGLMSASPWFLPFRRWFGWIRDNLFLPSFEHIPSFSDLTPPLVDGRVEQGMFLTAMCVWLGKGCDVFQQFHLSFELLSRLHIPRSVLKSVTPPPLPPRQSRAAPSPVASDDNLRREPEKPSRVLRYAQLRDALVALFNFLNDLTVIDKEDHDVDAIAREFFDLLDIRKAGSVKKVDFVTGLTIHIEHLSRLGLLPPLDTSRESHPIDTPLYKKFGATLFFGTPEFEMAFQMLLGMSLTHKALGKAQKGRTTTEDVYSEFSIVLPKFITPDHPLSGGPSTNVRFTCFGYFAFRELRKVFGINEEEFRQTFSIIKLLGHLLCGQLKSPCWQSTMGRSDAVFLYTNDGRYLIKKIAQAEFNVMQATLSHYYHHMQYIRKIGKRSLLSKYVYAFEMLGGRYVVMENIFATTNAIHEIYDLKGSKMSRSNPDGPIHKDNDLKKRLLIGDEKKQVLFRILSQDIRLLNLLKLTDYSLLLGIHYVRGRRSTIDPGRYFPKGLNRDLVMPKKPKPRKRKRRGNLASTAEDPLPDVLRQRQPPEEGLSIAATAPTTSMKEDELFTPDGGIISTNRKEIYYMGIIDMTTVYSRGKQAERVAKTVMHLGRRDEISSAPHEFYSQRLLYFLDNVFV